MSTQRSHSVGIIGASGFTGAELLRLLAVHPNLDVRLATGDSQAGTAVGDLYPSLAAAYPDLVFETFDPAVAAGLDVVFLGLPHGASQAIVPQLAGKVGLVVDLAADFRLDDPSLYPTWYGEEHQVPELLADAAYGLPELFRDDLAGASLVAGPGCYPTAAVLALAPVVRDLGVDLSTIVVDAASGVSGAGRPPKPGTTFAAVADNFAAYGLLDHRHTPEIEQTLTRLAGAGAEDVSVIFTPHLVPMSRGILATCYARPSTETTTEELLELYRAAYADEPFVVVTDASPSTKSTLGANTAHVTVRADPRTGWVLAISAIDNLVKGASGQALQCANLALGLPETTGLPIVGVYP